jgi:hypothetical protein
MATLLRKVGRGIGEHDCSPDCSPEVSSVYLLHTICSYLQHIGDFRMFNDAVSEWMPERDKDCFKLFEWLHKLEELNDLNYNFDNIQFKTNNFWGIEENIHETKWQKTYYGELIYNQMIYLDYGYNKYEWILRNQVFKSVGNNPTTKPSYIKYKKIDKLHTAGSKRGVFRCYGTYLGREPYHIIYNAPCSFVEGLFECKNYNILALIG